ncbi:MAG TPA: murein biosynthesis integral membrane protein MurJ [Anaerolineae bacterium]|nr:murein biosynthesis integral membrane protein MurJ [Anaerolineae bacterium]
MSAPTARPPREVFETDTDPKSADRFGTASFVKDSTVISALSFMGVAGAFLLDVVVAATFGLGYRTDAFFIAIAVPHLVWSILSSSTTRVLTPIFTQLLEEEGGQEVWRVFSLLANLSLIALPLLSIAGALLSPLILAVTGAGLQGEAASLAVALNRVLFLMLIPAGLIQVMNAVLNAHKHFAAPAGTTLLQYVIIIITVILLQGTMGVMSVALGYILSMVGQVLILGAVLLAKGARYVPSLNYRDPVVNKAAHLMVPPLGGEVLGQSISVIERALASFLPPGSVSALAFAGRILRALDITFLNNVVVAILPRLSSLSTAKDLLGLKRFISLGLKVSWAVTIPLTASILALSGPLVRLLFQRGAFDLQAVQLTSSVLSLYVVGLPLLAMLRLLMTAFYSMQDTTTPFFIRAGMLGVNLGGDLILMRVLGVAGLALATSLTYLLSAFVAAWLLRRRIGPLRLHLTRYLTKMSVAAAIMICTAIVLRAWFEPRIHTATPVILLLETTMVMSVAALTYLLAVVLLRIEEYQKLFGWVRRRRGSPEGWTQD